ncbi:MAG: hypothetical protein HY321_21635 [Armatimonadetes bacterium]|nr:hypothetical protein [Armatimonadota bacterium]
MRAQWVPGALRVAAVLLVAGVPCAGAPDAATGGSPALPARFRSAAVGALDLTGEAADLAPTLERSLARLLADAHLFEGGVRALGAGPDELRSVLRQVGYEAGRSEEAGESATARKALERLRKAGADVMIAAAITQIVARTTYDSTLEPVTPEDPPLKLPPEPAKPDPNARKYAQMGPRLYARGEADPRYRARLREWREAHACWERGAARARQEHENRRAGRQFAWRWRVRERPSVRLEVSAQLISVATGTMVWASPRVWGEAADERAYREQLLTVVGPASRPEAPEPTPSAVNAAPAALRQAALLLGTRRLLDAVRGEGSPLSR